MYKKIFFTLLIIFMMSVFAQAADAACATPVNECTADGDNIIIPVSNSGNKRWRKTVPGTINGILTTERLRDAETIIPNWLFTNTDYTSLSLRPHPQVVNPVLTKDDPDDAGTVNFIADPFMYYEDGIWYAFFEISGSGASCTNTCIGYATSDDALTWTYGAVVEFDATYSLSFPFVFKYAGEYYMLPSVWAGAGDNLIRIYKADTFPTAWSVYETTSDNMTGWSVGQSLDSVLFQFGGYWWIFVSDNANQTYAYYTTATSPIGATWTAHTSNPILSGFIKQSRSAGRPIVRDNYVIMFYQDPKSTEHTLTDDTATGADSATVLTAAAGDFVNDGAAVTDYIINTIDNSGCKITAINATTVTCSGGLSGGTDNTWQSGDIADIWDATVQYGKQMTAWKISTLTTSTYSQSELTTSPVLKGSARGGTHWRDKGMHQIDIWDTGNGNPIAIVDGYYGISPRTWSVGIYEVTK